MKVLAGNVRHFSKRRTLSADNTELVRNLRKQSRRVRLPWCGSFDCPSAYAHPTHMLSISLFVCLFVQL